MKRKNTGSLSRLLDYSSSESDEETAVVRDKIRLPPPKLPTFKECRSITREPVSRSSENKIRNFPHEPGNWATYVYIPVDSDSCDSREVHETVESLLCILSQFEMTRSDDFHISVTKTVVLRHHWIQDFADSIKKAASNIQPFSVSLSGFKVYANEAKTRTFVAMEVQKGSKQLCDIVQMTNKCLAEYNLSPFHEFPSFHMSLAWCIGNKVDEISAELEKAPQSLSSVIIEQDVNHLKCTSGNKTFRFGLANKNTF